MTAGTSTTRRGQAQGGVGDLVGDDLHARGDEQRRAQRIQPVVIGARAAARPRRVVMPSGVESWTVIGGELSPGRPVKAYLGWLSSIERSPNTVHTQPAHPAATTGPPAPCR